MKGESSVRAKRSARTGIAGFALWHHNGLVSALEVVHEKPAFLLFQIGPVQDFIAQSRSMIDLWSGSYLLSFLISKALATVALEVGPDTIIFPKLRGVPLLDWWWSRQTGLFPEDYFSFGKGRLHPNELLTSSLPNRFLALIPGGERGRKIALAAESAISNLWQQIADSVHADICLKIKDLLAGHNLSRWDVHWADQVRRFPVIDWVIHEWQPEQEAFAAVAATEPAPPLFGGWQDHPLRHAQLWRTMIPTTEREPWHGTRNDAFAWALHFATTDWKFAARKNARAFNPWPRLANGATAPPKDHLNGRDEVLGGASPEAFWDALRTAYGGASQGIFKGRQLYGALSVIKRLWQQTFLRDRLNWKSWKPDFESVPEVAGQRHKIGLMNRATSAEPDEELWDEDPKYYAVLCMDGDDMGQWVSGAKTPALQSVLADKAWGYFADVWHPAQAAGLTADRIRRPLSPGYHAAFSEAVSNFGLYCAGQIVEEFDGKLIYSAVTTYSRCCPRRPRSTAAMRCNAPIVGNLPKAHRSAFATPWSACLSFVLMVSSVAEAQGRTKTCGRTGRSWCPARKLQPQSVLPSAMSVHLC